ncbi:hypothetical protein [Oceanirhabdus seepicola]|uniref:Uncharacterized protein n=1 Tax=Oceanirhabdus seepicola TaxID=2828781 RepID=A0A9J6P551_9CLOT|nr:hypothetical protein [Oceanirhabdus seepicola]MCM1991372.1 hypothetical protein [Oceanirhabdus seepicola]
MSHSLKGKDVKAFNTSKKDKEMCSYNEYDTCRMCNRNTTERYLVILEFTHFTSFFNFSTKGDNFKNKEQINGVKVRIGI